MNQRPLPPLWGPFISNYRAHGQLKTQQPPAPREPVFSHGNPKTSEEPLLQPVGPRAGGRGFPEKQAVEGVPLLSCSRTSGETRSETDWQLVFQSLVHFSFLW